MAGRTQNGQKRCIFLVVPQLGIVDDTGFVKKKDGKILLKIETFYIMFESLKFFVFLMVLCRLFHKEGPMHDKVFCPMLVL